MSKSPKHTRTQLSEEADRRLRAEREKEREEARRREQEAEARRNAQRLEAARANIEKLRAGIHLDLQQLLTGPTASFTEATELSDIRDVLQTSTHHNKSATDLESIAEIEKHLHELRRKIHQSSQDAQKRQFESLQAELVSLAEHFERCCQETEPSAAQKFDPQGMAAVKHSVANLQAQVSKGNIEKARTLLDEGFVCLRQHQKRIAEETANFLAQRSRAETALLEAESRLSGCHADEVVMRWHASALTRLQSEISTIRSHFENEQFEDASRAANRLFQSVDKLKDDSHRDQLMEDKRQYILQSIQDELYNSGFTVSDSVLEDTDDMRSRRVILATLPSGSQLAIGVPQDGVICYEVDGFPMRQQEQQDGTLANTCDEAETVLTKLHENLLRHHDIETDGLHWEGKPDDVLIDSRKLQLRTQQSRSRERNSS